MDSRYRSFTGALIAVFAIPVFLGLTACLPSLPVPVGDPEKSRIDPYITGIWMLEDGEAFYVFEPYDKRTWIVSGVGIDEDTDYCEEKFAAAAAEDADLEDATEELNAYDELIAGLKRFGSECYEAEREPAVMKAWRTRLGGEWFMTWEPLGVFDSENGFGTKGWMVFHIDTTQANRLLLRIPGDDHEGFAAIQDLEEEEITRRDIEKILRKHGDDPELYYEEALIFYRVLPEHYDLFDDLFDAGW